MGLIKNLEHDPLRKNLLEANLVLPHWVHKKIFSASCYTCTQVYFLYVILSQHIFSDFFALHVFPEVHLCSSAVFSSSCNQTRIFHI